MIYEQLSVALPRHAGFQETSELLEALADDFAHIKVSRTNPHAAIGGPELDPGIQGAILLMLTAAAGVGVAAFAKRFFELLADDSHEGLRRLVVGIGKKLSGNRGPGFYVFVIVSRDAELKGPRYIRFKWQPTSEAEVQKLSAAVLDIPARSLRRASYLLWDSAAGEWKDYVPIVGPGEPIDDSALGDEP